MGVVGSVTWRDAGAFDRRDLVALVRHRNLVPGGDGATLVAVGRAGVQADGLIEAVYGPADLVAAWRVSVHRRGPTNSSSDLLRPRCLTIRCAAGAAARHVGTSRWLTRCRPAPALGSSAHAATR